VEIDLDFARELLAWECASSPNSRVGPERRRVLGSAQAVASGERVLHQLQERMIRWFGPDGVDALFIRALERTRVRYPIMSLVRHDAPSALSLAGMIDGMNDGPSSDESSAEQVTEAIVALIAMILALIGRLVGDEMTRHLVGQIWPQVPSEESLSNEGFNGKVDK
jgi:hypothetical protein